MFIQLIIEQLLGFLNKSVKTKGEREVVLLGKSKQSVSSQLKKGDDVPLSKIDTWRRDALAIFLSTITPFNSIIISCLNSV